MSGHRFIFFEGENEENIMGVYPNDLNLHLNFEIWVPGEESSAERSGIERSWSQSLSNLLSRMFNTENNLFLIPQRTIDKEKIAKEMMKKIISVKATEGECSICQCSFKKNSKVPSLTCHHQFHKKCLTNWIKIRETCPMCRADIKTSIKE